MSPILVDMFRHHTWATLRLIDFCRGLTPVQLETGSKGAFGTIRATLHHLISADGGYLAALTGGELQMLDADATLDGMAARVRERAAGWEALAADPGPLDRRISRRQTSADAAIILIQAIHHGNEHRGQVASILGEMGIEPPRLDSWTYGHEEGRATRG